MLNKKFFSEMYDMFENALVDSVEDIAKRENGGWVDTLDSELAKHPEYKALGKMIMDCMKKAAK